MRFLLAFILSAHGIAHLVGFVAAWRLASLPDLPYKTTILAGRVNLGDAGIRAVGVLWLAAALAFIWASGTVALGTRWALTVTMIATLASLGLCAAEWPQARIGLYVNAALLLLFMVPGVSSAVLSNAQP
jgi:hypothetical protein